MTQAQSIAGRILESLTDVGADDAVLLVTDEADKPLCSAKELRLLAKAVSKNKQKK
jgi:hypothetical protein